MTEGNVLAELAFLEADDRAVLYEARWNDEKAKTVVPRLIRLLDREDRDCRLRTLRGLVTVGRSSELAIQKVARLLQSVDDLVFHAAAITLSVVAADSPGPAVESLIKAAMPGREKPVMFALVNLGHAAKAATALFERGLSAPSAQMRRLALRGLAAVGADEETMHSALNAALRDKSKEVRSYAKKLASRFARRS